MLKLDDLKIFIATTEAGSFVQAARHLDIAPSVVSRSIKNLELQLKTTLFNRTTRKITLTGEGVWLRNRAIKTLDNLHEIRSHFADNNAELEGHLTIDAATSFTLHMLAPILSKFTDLYPGIRLSLEGNENITDLIEKKVDISIRIGELKDSGMKARKIGSVRRAFFASPDYIHKHGKPLDVTSLKDHKCLGFSQAPSLNNWPIKTENGDWLKITPHLTANNSETLKQLALHGNGILCLSDFTVRTEVARGELVPILENQIVPHAIPISAVYYSEHNVVRHIRVFLDFLAEHAEF
ncbi:LysR family transcriptional regulator [Kiloniella laminariae]|uniref:LysR family transcriptional regulator n=1 Tax=Kiloniella laminariae TaxID=454162 RepID=A0ABT4LEW7_9PROT|nr:LysR family transcriptional regulator [Kiloniella laminariae]MCZ4279635.1 LysR family transcriptional regulator [Kiloniella laminariae]